MAKDNDTYEHIAALAKNGTTRSQSARLRDLLPAVELALKAGVSRAEILAQLQADGYTIKLHTLDNLLHQYRIRRRGERDQHAVKPDTEPLADSGKFQSAAAEAPSDVCKADDFFGPLQIAELMRSEPDMSEIHGKIWRK